jgi:hypothetical protein
MDNGGSRASYSMNDETDEADEPFSSTAFSRTRAVESFYKIAW